MSPQSFREIHADLGAEILWRLYLHHCRQTLLRFWDKNTETLII